MEQFISKQPNEELNSKIAVVKKDILIEMEIIKERIKDKEYIGFTWNDLLTLKDVLNTIKEANNSLKPF